MPQASYWAHSAQNSQPGSDSRVGWQLLSFHLESVARIARELASTARPLDGNLANLAGISGLLHDFGKYSDCFQQMLRTGKGRCQHAIHGAMLAYFGAEGAARQPKLNTVMAAIAGHHAGLADWNVDYKKKLNDQRYRDEVEKLVALAVADCSELKRIVPRLNSQQDAFPGASKAKLDLFVRMLFSCLVDADRLNSAGLTPSQDALRSEERLQTLLSYISELQKASPNGPVKTMRAMVLEDCVHAASSEQKLFSLSVPTGGGKTLAAMAFALRRAALYPERFRRVIVVIPFLSIIEQNAQVYAKVFGQDAVFEHHSGSIQNLVKKRDEDQFVPAPEIEGDEEKRYQETGKRLETENWDAPIVVTTSVRFFESMFSNRPADLRRVHNIARSIVILDEVQTLPRRLLGPLLDMMKELAEDWDTNFVFSTATQPAFERPQHKRDLRWAPGTLTEIIHDPASLHQALKRVEICWEIKPEQAVGWPEMAQRMTAQPQCLAIVNVRDHAGQLYEELLRVVTEKGLPAEGVFHLSTRMCAAHRLRVLDKIRKRLKGNESCHVVSTQLVEAGVDLDFPLVLRALAPLDSIIQAAGRADREGKLTAALGGRPGGKVVVFLPEDHKLPPNEYKEAAGITASIAEQALLDGASVQVDSAQTIRDYFERYYGVSGTDLGEKLLDLRKGLNFASLAQEFEMISNRTRDVFVPDDEEAQKAIEELHSAGELTPTLRRKLRRHVVGLSPSEFEKAKGVVERVPTAAGDEIWVAVDQAYDEQLGLIFNPGPGRFVL